MKTSLMRLNSMARYKQRNRSNGVVMAVVILAITAYAYRAYLAEVLCGLSLFAALLVLPKLLRRMRRPYHSAVADLDSMDGLDFERYIADLLTQRGFQNVSLTEQYDMGVDIVAEKDGVRWGIQVKRYSGLVKAAAVRQVVTALRFYDCDRAMVITNSSYSAVARKLADSNDCVLIDRGELLGLIG